jgi:antitoxin component YwqK of YwqJK toxin-antitoxin module
MVIRPPVTMAARGTFGRAMQLRSFFLTALVLVAHWALAQPPLAPNSMDAQGRKQGAWSKTWPNGQLRYTGQFKDDRPVGEFKHFNDRGKIETVQQHAGDGIISRARHFYPDGSLMATGKYVRQQKDSTWNYYMADGQLKKVERYAAGHLHGEQVTYYPGGQMAEREQRVNGEMHGPSMSWFPDGKLKSEATYEKGEAEGRMVFYYPKGNREIEGNLVNGDRDGTWIYYNADGTIQLQILYARGQVVKERKENGTFREYYDDEQVQSEVIYKKGKREGKFTEYYGNGRWTMKPVPSDSEVSTPAEVERVLEGQTKKREGTYVNDLLEGEVKEYDENGKLLKVTRYVGGVEQ